MLDLNSSRWSQLESHFGEGASVPRLVESWKAAIGTPAENETYEVLFEHYLHQLTILACAYAVVPHVVSALSRVSVAHRLKYLSHVGWVEMSRLDREEVEAAASAVAQSDEVPEPMRDHFVMITRQRHPDLPTDLASDYLRAVEEAKAQSVSLLCEPWASSDFSRLLGVLTALFARRETDLAGALLNPRGLSLECEYEGKSSISMLFRDRSSV